MGYENFIRFSIRYSGESYRDLRAPLRVAQKISKVLFETYK